MRKGDVSVFGKRNTVSNKNENEPLWLSAVVLEELYVGAVNPKLQKLLKKFENDFIKINRLLVPNQNDWVICGQVLSKIGRKYGFDLVKRARMTNDCLIAMSAGRNALTVFTHNAADFEIISEFRSFKWKEVKE